MNKLNRYFRGVLAALEAIRDGKPAEYRPLEEYKWRDFDPSNDEIDTENNVYRAKPEGYPEDQNDHMLFSHEELQEDRIYYAYPKNPDDPISYYVCVRYNYYDENNKEIGLNFKKRVSCRGNLYEIYDPNISIYQSEPSKVFANIICPHLVMENPENYYFCLPSLKDVKMIKAELDLIGYEFKDGNMQKV